MWRKVISRTRGSSSSSNAALRYSAAKSGSFRGRQMMASSRETLALRFIKYSPFFVNFEVFQPPVDIRGLLSFVATKAVLDKC